MCADDGGSIVSTRAGPNLRAIRKTARRLRADERTDTVTEALLVLLHTSAALADQVTADDPANDVPIYARQKVLSAHGTMLGQLAELVGPVTSDTALDAFLAALTVPWSGGSDEGHP
jgi:hypothetical protein